MKIKNGFTLVELMTTLVVSTTLISIAAPNFSSLYQHYRADSAIRVIQQTLQMARNTAISYGVRVTTCPLVDNRCNDNWSLGLTVFTDSGERYIVDGTDLIIYQTSPFKDEDTVIYNRAAIRFQPDGLASGTNGTLKYCPTTPDSQYSRAVIINQAGRVRFSTKEGISCRK
ncbi:GspH/FimT family pseudopilin [Shewanella sp.]|uniref:GspH/FimT family pseudopilin n=1 Tax=Shewanella sp. TaxID=50422 RepID=UPI001ECE9A70|nr:GspH/FimT family pseudopilin [Shewanella sp.]NRB25264.1 type II transport protein GspH [Shewanella sp.]